MFLHYPPGDYEQDDFWVPDPLDLYAWNAETGERRKLAVGAIRAFLDPTGSRVALFMDGKPQMGPDGPTVTESSCPYLALLSWPEWQLVGSYPLGGESRFARDWPGPIWSVDGARLVFQPWEDSLFWMDRDGKVGPILSGIEVQWAGWGADGILALLIDGRIWLVRLP